MTKALDWNFVPTGGGDIDGLNNSMVEHFTGNYNYFLAREIIQNSLDAKDKTMFGPVKVEFKLESFSKTEFPGYERLINVIKQARDFWAHHEETVSFLDNAEACLKKERIPFLRISDYNTVGLSGGDEDMQGGWFNLVRSTGASSKSAGEGGSFGIGKGAPFAASDLRVVFYATKNQQSMSVFQGKAELVSFKDDTGEKRRGVGSFGINHHSVRGLQDIPESFRRKRQGTDIIIAGYKKTADWVEDLLKSILRNFWYAIHAGDLQVDVEQNSINTSNLSEYLVKYFANEPFKDYVEPIGNPLQFYLALTTGDELGELKKLENLKECKFYFKMIGEHMNYVAMLRKSHMVIYSRRFNFPGNFAGVFICDNEAGNSELRKMEPPAHDKWDPKRHKEKGEMVMNEITNFIRECLDKVKKSQTFGILEIPDLQRLLPYDEGNESGGGQGNAEYTKREGKEETSQSIQKTENFHSKVTINPYKVSIINDKEQEPERGHGNGNGGNGGGGGGSTPSSKKKVKNFHSRSYIISQKNDQVVYRILLRSKEDIRCNLKLVAVGEEGSERLKISKVYDHKNTKFLYSENQIRLLQLPRNVDTEFNVEIDSAYKLALKVEANVI